MEILVGRPGEIRIVCTEALATGGSLVETVLLLAQKVLVYLAGLLVGCS